MPKFIVAELEIVQDTLDNSAADPQCPDADNFRATINSVLVLSAGYLRSLLAQNGKVDFAFHCSLKDERDIHVTTSLPTEFWMDAHGNLHPPQPVKLTETDRAAQGALDAARRPREGSILEKK